VHSDHPRNERAGFKAAPPTVAESVCVVSIESYSCLECGLRFSQPGDKTVRQADPNLGTIGDERLTPPAG
jgi:hypothetical protein